MKTKTEELIINFYIGQEDVNEAFSLRATINEPDCKGKTLLHHAIEYSYNYGIVLRIIETLIAAGANLDQLTAGGKSPLQLATKQEVN